MDPLLILAVLAGGFIAGTLSGLSGGGGGMLMVPLFIAVGLTPQQAVATGKMNGLGAAFGGLSVFWKSGHVRRDIIRIMIPIAVIIGLLTPLVFRHIDSELMQKIIGILLIVMAPTLFIRRKTKFHRFKKGKKSLGYIFYSLILLLQSLFGTGVGILAIFALTLGLDTTKIEANATKRAVTAVLTPITFIALLLYGFVNVVYGFAALIGTFAGTHFGSKIALRKGETFITYSMFVVITLSGILLLID